jgi:hypothetical protein
MKNVSDRPAADCKVLDERINNQNGIVVYDGRHKIQSMELA